MSKIVAVKVLLLEQYLNELKKKTGIYIAKDAVAKAVDHYLTFGMSEEDIRAIDKDLKEMREEEMEQHSKDQELLEKIKLQVSEEEFNSIEEEIIESENTANFKIVDTPIGIMQEEEGVKMWVDQHSAGDVFTGTVCMELPDGKYIMWDYWM